MIFERGIRRDGAQLDAFGRMRVSDPVTLFDSQQQYNASPLLWESIGDGTATHIPDEAAVQLSVTAAQSIKRQTRAYHRYQPGKSQLVLLTGVLGAGVAGTTRRIGYYDDSDGVFIEMSGTSVRFVLRSSASGSPVDTAVDQASWALDVAEWLDTTKTQIIFFDMEWLGSGRVRAGFVLDGQFVECHEFLNANNKTVVYMRTANLPVRYELISTGGAADDMRQICCSVMSEGGFEEGRGIPQTANNATGVALSTANETPILSIRPKATFNSITNRGTIIPLAVTLLTKSNDIIWRVRYGATLTSASFASVGSNSITEFDTAATAATGGEVIYSDFLASGGGQAAQSAGTQILSRLPLVLDSAGANPIPLTLTAQRLSVTAPTVFGAMNWREIY